MNNIIYSLFSTSETVLQEFFDSGFITEDCLTLDIYRPEGVVGGAILFWIHGGAFVTGTSHLYDGIEQAKRGNIVVSIQYRLGVFGFMNLWDEEKTETVGGNYGLADQQLALRFVADNAVALGGDPERITINGESAGAMSVALHLHNANSRKFVQDLIKIVILLRRTYFCGDCAVWQHD